MILSCNGIYSLVVPCKALCEISVYIFWALHMYQCPNCNQPGITYIEKWCSCAAGPTKCIHCKNLSYVPETVSSAIFCFGIVLLLLTIIVAVFTSSWSLAILGFVCSIACYGMLWHIVELRPTTLEHAASARKLSWRLLIVAGIINLMSWTKTPRCNVRFGSIADVHYRPKAGPRRSPQMQTVLNNPSANPLLAPYELF